MTLGVLWGGAMLIIGVVHAFTPSYGAGFFAVMGSIYPGIEGTGTAGDVILGMVYGLVDGALSGLAPWGETNSLDTVDRSLVFDCRRRPFAA